MSIWDRAPKNTEAVYSRLKLLAKRMRVETYGEIAAAMGNAEGREIAAISLNQPLGFIRDEICRRQGLPWLSALAVSAKDWRPGDSFLPLGVTFGGDEDVLWRGAVLATFGYPWDSVNVD